MSVFREQTFKYDGDTLSFIPSLALLKRIKSRGINNVVMANKCIHGGVDIEDLAAVHCEVVRAAGGDITEEVSYAFLTGGNQDEIVSFQQAYISSVLPSVDFGKKPVAQKSQGKPKRKAKKKTTT
tara:strand:- start:109 stop:483 length:375 start_codon:yes stop_codon:yes gene_type:complete